MGGVGRDAYDGSGAGVLLQRGDGRVYVARPASARSPASLRRGGRPAAAWLGDAPRSLRQALLRRPQQQDHAVHRPQARALRQAREFTTFLCLSVFSFIFVLLLLRNKGPSSRRIA